MKKFTRIIAGATAAVLSLSLAACGGDKDTAGKSGTITWWIANSAAPNMKSYDDITAWQKIQEKFGVDIEFVHPATQQSTEQFNIMAASGDFKDIVSYNWNGYTGGPVKAVKDNVIIGLDSYLETNLPNVKKYMDEDAAINYLARCYDGSVAVIPAFTTDTVTEAAFGPQIRKDWLDKLGLEAPATMEDWYNVLKAFKTQDPNGNGEADEVPFVADGTMTFMRFSRAYNGVEEGFYIKNGKVAFGIIEPEFKEFLTEINKWYSEGLIDQEYAAASASIRDTKMISDIGGAYVGYAGSSMSKYLAAGRTSNPDYSLVGVQWPSANGGAPRSGYPYQIARGTPSNGMAISAKNTNVEKSLEIIDYLYSDEGSTLMNWGILGETYEETEEGYKYTDKIMKSPDGKSPIDAISQYALPQWPCAMKRADAYMQLNGIFPEQTDAMTLWNEADTSAILPSLTFSTEEQAEITKVMDDIYIYRQECINKLVMGVEPISAWDGMCAKIREMGIDKAIAVYQKAYDRYINK